MCVGIVHNYCMLALTGVMVYATLHMRTVNINQGNTTIQSKLFNVHIFVFVKAFISPLYSSECDFKCYSKYSDLTQLLTMSNKGIHTHILMLIARRVSALRLNTVAPRVINDK